MDREKGIGMLLSWGLLATILWDNIVLIEAAPQSALITTLPGFSGNFPSRHYSGYVTLDLDGKASKNLFYYFVESERNPSKDPVVLWLNGGPGCSSFDGFVYEHGPFNFEAGIPRGSMPKLHLNPYSWSKVSNIIYLDSPTGVGFSYSPNTTVYKTGDLQTANDSHHFLLKWFDLYPEYQSNVFYLSGESYAGAYVPTLASEVVKGIKAKVNPVINFKGYMVGNGVIHDINFSGENALVPFAHGMALISEDFFQGAQIACNGDYNNNNNSSACNTALDKIYRVLDGLNIYNILEPCFHDPSSLTKASQLKNVTLPSSFMQLGESTRFLSVRTRMFGRAWPYRVREHEGDTSSSPMLLWPELAASMAASGNVVPCTDDIVATTWLNNDAVRKAIHVSPESGSWKLCGAPLEYYGDAGSLIKYHRNLTQQGYRALIYSGDHDMCVPFTGTEAWTRSLGYKIIDEWRPWISNDQVAGYTQGYAHGLVFLTIKGSGHTVPEYKPQEALDFYSRWLEGKSI
ncbi:serine carboxypeptidase-like 20 [Impatiens glandulifera]|uniref:serine carboxypeptidase-like 20 n=1 Tax=Impatiens glandulifera TaxID=253017 RepID=UPI001FB1948E|nr:serine carboxypeptidase-like 20 [Impatiens glandulifera]